MNIMSMKTVAKALNDMTFTDYFYRLSLLARTVFEWKNLPNGINEKWIERFLFEQGKCIFFRDPMRGLMVSQCTEDGTVNNYEESITATPSGVDVPTESLVVNQECVIIRNNDDTIPTAFPVKLFAYRLAELTRAIDVNVQAQKTPVLLLTSEKQRLTMKNIYAQWSGNEPVIYGDKNLDTENIRAIKTDAPIVFPDLQVQKQTLWNECLTFLGINNANTEKRERLITDEVEANNTHIDLSAGALLKSRQEAAAKINEIFGTNITVERRKVGENECMPDTPNT